MSKLSDITAFPRLVSAPGDVVGAVRGSANIGIDIGAIGERVTTLEAVGGGPIGASLYFDTLAQGVANAVAATVKTFITGGFANPGDGGRGDYVRRAAHPYALWVTATTYAATTRIRGANGRLYLVSTKPNNPSTVQPVHASGEVIGADGYGWTQFDLSPGYPRTVDRYKYDGTFDAIDGGWWQIVIPNAGIAVECFGGKADSRGADGTANDMPVRWAIESIDSSWDSTFPYYRGGAKVLFGYSAIASWGGYRFVSPITPNRTCHLKGASGGGARANAGWATTFWFPAGSKGIILNSATGSVAGNSIAPGAAFTVIEDIHFESLGHGGMTDQHGFNGGTQFIVRNCNFVNFGGHGVSIRADVTFSTFNNANLWRLDTVRSAANAGSGFFTEGGDSNAGTATHCDASSNGRWGVEDGSFLGCNWFGTHTDANVLGPATTLDGNACSLFAGLYAEGGQPFAQINYPSMVIGGNGPQINAGSGQRFFNYHMSGFESATLGNDAAFIVDYNRTANSIFNVSGDPGPVYRQGLSYNSFFKTINYGGDGISTYHITRSDTTFTAGRGSSIGGGNFVFWEGFWFGGSQLDAMRHQTNGTAAPTTGLHAAGDVVWNRTPTLNSVIGWICTVTGTPGTWAGFGTLDWTASHTYDPPSLAAGAVSPIQEFTSIFFGVGFGAFVKATFSQDMLGVILNAWTGNDRVYYQFYNPTAGTIDLASGTVKVRVNL